MDESLMFMLDFVVGDFVNVYEPFCFSLGSFVDWCTPFLVHY